MRSIFFSILLFFPMLASAQTNAIIDSRTKSITNHSSLNSIELTLVQLAKSITAGKNSPQQKTDAIFNWITANISYDHELRYNPKLQKKIYTSENNVLKHVLQRKKAVCGGFSFLFERLCNIANIEAQTIHGYSKNPATNQFSASVNHSWNKVKINGSWQLLDISWAISHGSNKKPNRFWYQTDTSVFTATHRPEAKNTTKN